MSGDSGSPRRSGSDARRFRLVMMFHPTHRVPDLVAAEQWFERVFGRPSTRLDALTGGTSPDPDNRNDYSTFTTIADVVFDTLDPARYVKGGRQRYPSVERPHLNGFGWYVEGITDAYRELRAQGFAVVDQRDDPAQGDDPPAADGGGLPMFWLTPDDAGLRYQFLPLFPFPGDPRVAQGWNVPPVSDDDPLGIERCSHHTVLTENPKRALRLFVDVLGGEVIHEGRTETLGASSTFVHLADGTYEFAVPDEGTEARADWSANAPNDTYHALTFAVADLDRAARHLESCGVRIRTRTDSALVTDPDTSLGVPWGFAADLTPGDPRGT